MSVQSELQQHSGLLREPEVLKLVPISRATLWSRVRAGTFPAPFKISERVTAWRTDDVRQFIDALKRWSSDEPGKRPCTQ